MSRCPAVVVPAFLVVFPAFLVVFVVVVAVAVVVVNFVVVVVVAVVTVVAAGFDETRGIGGDKDRDLNIKHNRFARRTRIFLKSRRNRCQEDPIW